MRNAAWFAPAASATSGKSRRPTCSSSSTAADRPRSRPTTAVPSLTSTPATSRMFVRWARSCRRISASRCGSGFSRGPSRSVRDVRPVATSLSTTATAKPSGSGRAATSRSTNPGCATLAATSTRTSAPDVLPPRIRPGARSRLCRRFWTKSPQSFRPRARTRRFWLLLARVMKMPLPSRSWPRQVKAVSTSV